MTLGQNDTTNTNVYTIFTNNDYNNAAAVEKNKKESTATTKNDFITFYMENINPLITQYEKDLLISYNDELSEEVIINAIKEAIEHNARNIKYIKTILNRYIQQGFKTLEQIKNQQDINKKETKKEETFEEQVERYKREWGIEDED